MVLLRGIPKSGLQFVKRAHDMQVKKLGREGLVIKEGSDK
jgi:hypothetical protein